MSKENKCCCMIAALVALAVVLGITYVSGYSMGRWTVTTWLAAAVIVVTAAFCWLCRSRENDSC